MFLGLKAQPTDTSIFTPSPCNCWCTLWAEILIRRPTGNVSWMMRIQNEPDLTEAFPDFPLADISSLFLPDRNVELESATVESKIDTNSIGENEYEKLLLTHFEGEEVASVSIPAIGTVKLGFYIVLVCKRPRGLDTR